MFALWRNGDFDGRWKATPNLLIAKQIALGRRKPIS